MALTVFNIIRISMYSAVIAWTLIVLGLAIHLDQMLIANDLTRFIPLAIFVSAATLLIIPALIIFGFINRAFLIQQVRAELAFTGLLGLLWFILGIYTALEKDTEVECDFNGDGDWIESDEFSTDTFHAQYHTLEAFSIFNAILLFAFFFLLLLLALRDHRAGETEVWQDPVVDHYWFGDAAATAPRKQMSQGLPAPVTTKFMNNPFSKGGNKTQPVQGTVTTGTIDGTETPMKAGGHYIIYIPPPAARR